jgi:hypothetical protein
VKEKLRSRGAGEQKGARLSGVNREGMKKTELFPDKRRRILGS